MFGNDKEIQVLKKCRDENAFMLREHESRIRSLENDNRIASDMVRAICDWLKIENIPLKEKLYGSPLIVLRKKKAVKKKK